MQSSDNHTSPMTRRQARKRAADELVDITTTKLTTPNTPKVKTPVIHEVPADSKLVVTKIREVETSKTDSEIFKEMPWDLLIATMIEILDNETSNVASRKLGGVWETSCGTSIFE